MLLLILTITIISIWIVIQLILFGMTNHLLYVKIGSQTMARIMFQFKYNTCQSFCRTVVALILAAFIHSAYALPENPYPFTAASDTKRFEILTKEIRCVVCQNQNIADSNAPLAKDLRAKIYYMMNDKKSDEEIKDYLVKRYGEFILLRPRLNQTTAILWTFPFAIMIIIFIFLFRFVRNTAKSPA